MRVEILRTRAEIRKRVRSLRRVGESIGLVPTMGALHEGHASLVRRSVRDNRHTIVTIFVNPLQFGPSEDLAAYPRQLEADARIVEGAGAGILFAPSPPEVYPEGDATFVTVEGLTRGLCGQCRPSHFRGVTTVVAKLLLLASPDRAYFGQKDAQQARVIRRMVLDLGFDAEIVVLPTVREPDGLALSSRNRYLSPEERTRALALSRALAAARACFASGERRAKALLEQARRSLSETPGVELDYLELVDDETLEPIDTVSSAALLAVAARVGPARLIDNVVLGASRVVAAEE